MPVKGTIRQVHIERSVFLEQGCSRTHNTVFFFLDMNNPFDEFYFSVLNMSSPCSKIRLEVLHTGSPFQQIDFTVLYMSSPCSKIRLEVLHTGSPLQQIDFTVLYMGNSLCKYDMPVLYMRKPLRKLIPPAFDMRDLVGKSILFILNVDRPLNKLCKHRLKLTEPLCQLDVLFPKLPSCGRHKLMIQALKHFPPLLQGFLPYPQGRHP